MVLNNVVCLMCHFYLSWFIYFYFTESFYFLDTPLEYNHIRTLLQHHKNDKSLSYIFSMNVKRHKKLRIRSPNKQTKYFQFSELN